MFEFNDKLGSRSLKHLNLLIARDGDGNTVVCQFQGKSIPGIVKMVSADFTKNGKWSHNTWTVEPADGVQCATISQDWETGKWLNSLAWSQAVDEFKKKTRIIGLGSWIPVEIPDKAVIRFIRATWPKIATELDKNDSEIGPSMSDAIDSLIAAQNDLAAAQQELAAAQQEIVRMEREQAAITEAAAIRQRVASAREAMKKGASLADLKSLLG